MGYSSLENAAFELNHPKWGKILIVCNEFAPRDEVLVWTRELISNDKYKNYKVIYLTHSFLFQRSAQNKFLKRRKLLMHWEILIMVRIYRKNLWNRRRISCLWYADIPERKYIPIHRCLESLLLLNIWHIEQN